MSSKWIIAASILTAVVGAPRICAQEAGNAEAARRPNILLIISDDVGVDATADMYPHLIEDLTAQYGPKGLNHPNYRSIAGRPASTPVLAELARQGMVFTNV